MASSEDVHDADCCEFFKLNVEKELAKKLGPKDKVEGKNTTVRKILKDGLGEKPDVISFCEASSMSKHQDRATKKITAEKFVQFVLPDIAMFKTKTKSVDDPKAVAELAKIKKKLSDKLKEMQSDTGKGKSAAVVDRLTDTSKYTGAHKERFDKSGKGKGIDGREEQVDSSGYVGNYKGAGTFEKK
eukprot:GHVL01031235.1.p1 GENE.GHVL01031235.1~~GHVL01031235.1.p1  ORF type:complete len:186 (+),score=13.77 GHVL01031235.1:140-697(+)